MSILESVKWVDDNFSLLQEKYRGKFIAILNKEVIAVGESFDEVTNKADRITTKEYLIDFVDRGDLHAYNFGNPSSKS